MGQLTIRSVPDDVVHALRAEAGRRRTSLNAVVRQALADHVARQRRLIDLQAWLPQLDAVRHDILVSHAMEATTDSTSLIREDRSR
jgi:plasmid stability protein